MRVLLVIPYPTTQKSGGVESVAKYTVEGFQKIEERLQNQNIKISILSSNGQSILSRDKGPTNGTQIEYHYFEPLKPRWFFEDFQGLLNLKCSNINPDLIHTHNLGFATAGPLLGNPTLFTLHGMVWQEKQYVSSPFGKLAKSMKTKKIPQIDKLVDEYIAISPYVAEEFQSKFGTLESNFSIVENPISGSYYQIDDKVTFNQILCPALVRPLKNQRTLIEALNLIDLEEYNTEVVFAGGIKDNSYFEQLLEIACKKDLEDRVKFVGHVSQERLMELYEESTIVCLPSLQETAPMVVAEGMASGTPVVASDVGGVSYMIENGKSGYLFNPTDEKELADKLSVLISNQNLRDEMGTAGREIAQRWRPEVIANQLVDLYLKYE